MIAKEDRLALSAATAEESLALESWEELLATTPFLEISPNTQRLAPLIFHNLRDVEAVPERNRLRGAYKHTWSKNLRLISAFLPVVESLNTAGINYRVIKGVAVQLLTGLLGARVVGDIDVVVSSADLEKTVEMLEQHGFRCNTRALCGFHSEGSAEAALGFNLGDNHIDLHVAERKEPRRLLRAMLAASPRLVNLRGIDIPVPSAEALTLHASLHGYRGASETDLIQALTDRSLLSPWASQADLGRLGRKTGTARVWRIAGKYSAERRERAPYGRSEPTSRFRPEQDGPHPLLIARLPRAVTLIRHRFPTLSVVQSVLAGFPGRRLAYVTWLLLGRFADVERFLLSKGGFLTPPAEVASPPASAQPFDSERGVPGLTASSVADHTMDYRFAVRVDPESGPTKLTLVSKYLDEMNLSVYLDGVRALKVITGAHIEKSILLPRGSEHHEISLRYTQQACKWCFRTLADLSVSLEDLPARQNGRQ